MLGRRTFLAGLLAANSAPARAQTTNDYLIVPYERIGPVHVNMAVWQVATLAGSPNETFHDDSGIWGYRFGDIQVQMHNYSNLVSNASVRSAEYRTTEGARVGMTDADFRGLYGRANNAWPRDGRATWTQFDYDGLSYRSRNDDHVIYEIIVQMRRN